MSLRSYEDQRWAEDRGARLDAPQLRHGDVFTFTDGQDAYRVDFSSVMPEGVRTGRINVKVKVPHYGFVRIGHHSYVVVRDGRGGCNFVDRMPTR